MEKLPLLQWKQRPLASDYGAISSTRAFLDFAPTYCSHLATDKCGFIAVNEPMSLAFGATKLIRCGSYNPFCPSEPNWVGQSIQLQDLLSAGLNHIHDLPAYSCIAAAPVILSYRGTFSTYWLQGAFDIRRSGTLASPHQRMGARLERVIGTSFSRTKPCKARVDFDDLSAEYDAVSHCFHCRLAIDFSVMSVRHVPDGKFSMEAGIELYL